MNVALSLFKIGTKISQNCCYPLFNIFQVIKEIRRLEKIIDKLSDQPVADGLPPLVAVNDEYHIQDFESPVENLNYLLDILEDLLDTVDEQKEK